MCGIIEKIQAFPKKGEAGTELSEARLIDNMGLEGDFHAVGGAVSASRQISLRFTRNAQTTGTEKRGLCFNRFKENISISGITRAENGMRLTSGEAVLEITGETKHCHAECPLFAAGERCSLAGMSLFAKVIKGGVIKTGGKIFLLCDTL
jgi:MOSC domain-containing protein YiiM